MQTTMLGHSCVRLEHQGTIVVLDPGAYSRPDALLGADAVLITHEHVDHLDVDRVNDALAAEPALQVWTVAAVAAKLGSHGSRLHVIGDGDTFDIGPFAVQVHGRLHHDIHPDLPRVPNSGFLLHVDGTALLHPGDAFTVPDTQIDVLFLPLHAPWSRLGDVVDYLRAVSPRRGVAIHDAGLSAVGLTSAGTILGMLAAGVPYARYAPGDGLNDVAGL